MKDGIFKLNWTPLTISAKKALMMMMIRTTRPLKFTGSFVIVTSMETFGKVCILHLLLQIYFKNNI